MMSYTKYRLLDLIQVHVLHNQLIHMNYIVYYRICTKYVIVKFVLTSTKSSATPFQAL